MLEEKRHRIERLLLRRRGALLVINDRGQKARRRFTGSYETGALSPVSSMIFPGRAREGGSYETGPATLAISH